MNATFGKIFFLFLWDVQEISYPWDRNQSGQAEAINTEELSGYSDNEIVNLDFPVWVY